MRRRLILATLCIALVAATWWIFFFKRIAEGAIGVSVGTPDDVAAFKTPRP